MLKTATLSRDFVPSESFVIFFFFVLGVSEWLVVIYFIIIILEHCVRSLGSKLRVSTRPVDHNCNDDG